MDIFYIFTYFASNLEMVILVILRLYKVICDHCLQKLRSVALILWSPYGLQNVHRDPLCELFAT